MNRRLPFSAAPRMNAPKWLNTIHCEGQSSWDGQIDTLRAYAILTVVLGHSIILYSDSWFVYTSTQSSPICNFLKAFINLYQMPLFFSISGYLFAKSKKKPIFASFLLAKGKRLLIPFLLIGLFYMIPIKIVFHYPPYDGKSYLAIIRLFLNGSDTGHLWYLPTLFLIFVVSFFLKSVAGNRLLTWIVATIAGLVLWTFRLSVPIFHPLFVYCRWIMEYLWCFSFGAMLFHFHHQTRPPSVFLFIAVRVCVIILSVFVVLSDALNFLRIPSAIASLVLVSGFYFFTPNIQCKPILKAISDNSFGLYLFHSPLIYITFNFFLNANPIIVVCINFVMMGSVAYLLSALVSRGRLKFLIGR